MAMKAIVKSASKLTVTPNLVDYDAACAPGFWERAREELDGLPGDGGLNIAYEAVDRHASGARADHLALRCLGKRGKVHDFTYAALGGQMALYPEKPAAAFGTRPIPTEWPLRPVSKAANCGSPAA